MRKLNSLVLIVCLFAPVLAGEVNTPGKTEVPPCTENCTGLITNTTSTPVTIEEQLWQALLELTLTIISR